MLARAFISGALFLYGSALAGPVLEARNPPATVIEPVTHVGSWTVAFTSSVDSPVTVSEWTQVAITTSYIDPVEVWTSSVGPIATSIPFSCVFPAAAVSTEVGTLGVDEPTTSVVAVTSVLASPSIASATTQVQNLSVDEPMLVITSVLASSSFAVVCPSQPVPSTQGVVTITQSFATPTTQSPVAVITQASAAVTTQASVAVTTQAFVAVTTQSAGPATSTGTVGAGNLVLDANSATLKVVSIQLAAVATCFALVAAGGTLFV